MSVASFSIIPCCFVKEIMDNPRVGSLNSLADYGLGESDIEDSDDEVEGEDNRVTLIPARPSISVAQARVKTSKNEFHLSTWSVVPCFFHTG